MPRAASVRFAVDRVSSAYSCPNLKPAKHIKHNPLVLSDAVALQSLVSQWQPTKNTIHAQGWKRKPFHAEIRRGSLPHFGNSERCQCSSVSRVEIGCQRRRGEPGEGAGQQCRFVTRSRRVPTAGFAFYLGRSARYGHPPGADLFAQCIALCKQQWSPVPSFSRNFRCSTARSPLASCQTVEGCCAMPGGPARPGLPALAALAALALASNTTTKTSTT